MKKRKIEGEFATLYGELVDHETKFFEYFECHSTVLIYY